MATAFVGCSLPPQQSSCLTIQMQKDESKGGKKQLSDIPAHGSIVLMNCALTHSMNISCVDKFYFMLTMCPHGEYCHIENKGIREELKAVNRRRCSETLAFILSWSGECAFHICYDTTYSCTFSRRSKMPITRAVAAKAVLQQNLSLFN